ncbi:MAG: helix-turn-helix domain-containing protein [Pirellulales bacterium]
MANTNATELAGLLATNIKVFLEVKSAYDQCEPEIRAVVDDMCAICSSPETSQDQKRRAMNTILEALFPSLAVDILDSEDRVLSTPDAIEYERELDAQEGTFANRLRATMQAKGWTQEKLAERTGVGQPAISNMLNRQCRPQQRTVRRLAEALEVSPEELWPGISSTE